VPTMTGWEELESAPTLADRVLARVRRRQARRIGWTVGAVLLVGVAVVLPIAWPSRDAGPAIAQATRGSGPTSSGARPSVLVERAEIYAAALAGLAGPGRRVQVRGRVCAGDATGPVAACTGEPIPAAVAHEVSRLVRGGVRFVEQPRRPYRPGDPPVVTFGPLDIAGPRASLRRELLCGPLCGQGETLVLRRIDGRWRVTGTQGPEWVS
jgi:hypothetical protein